MTFSLSAISSCDSTTCNSLFIWHSLSLCPVSLGCLWLIFSITAVYLFESPYSAVSSCDISRLLSLRKAFSLSLLSLQVTSLHSVVSALVSAVSSCDIPSLSAVSSCDILPPCWLSLPWYPPTLPSLHKTSPHSAARLWLTFVQYVADPLNVTVTVPACSSPVTLGQWQCLHWVLVIIHWWQSLGDSHSACCPFESCLPPGVPSPAEMPFHPVTAALMYRGVYTIPELLREHAPTQLPEDEIEGK